ncbi:MAG: hypothetical protein HQK51_20215, partial [Oligoflexia bacterium]|nr:hypothetical protein [Oligoflexia bacterium]
LRPDITNPIEVLKYLVINEGIAHFIGYTLDRTVMFTDHGDKWPTSEQNLKEVISKLSNPNIEMKEIEELLFKANTGKYWDKYASIAGMFRATKIYSQSGANGIINCIKNNELPYIK